MAPRRLHEPNRYTAEAKGIVKEKNLANVAKPKTAVPDNPIRWFDMYTDLLTDNERTLALPSTTARKMVVPPQGVWQRMRKDVDRFDVEFWQLLFPKQNNPHWCEDTIAVAWCLDAGDVTPRTKIWAVFEKVADNAFLDGLFHGHPAMNCWQWRQIYHIATYYNSPSTENALIFYMPWNASCNQQAHILRQHGHVVGVKIWDFDFYQNKLGTEYDIMHLMDRIAEVVYLNAYPYDCWMIWVAYTVLAICALSDTDVLYWTPPAPFGRKRHKQAVKVLKGDMIILPARLPIKVTAGIHVCYLW